jgi:hypothetical protein
MAGSSDPSGNSSGIKKRRGPGRPFVKGESGNPLGVPRSAWELRKALLQDGPEVHAALMTLVRDGNPQAVIYAHRQLIGDPKQTIEVSEVRELSDEQLREMARQVLAHEAATH